MKKINVIQSIEVHTNAAKAWEIIGPNFLNISYWGSGVLKSWNNEQIQPKFQQAPAGGRCCELKGFGKFDEEIIHYNENNYEISWSAKGEKLPKFVKDLQNEIKVESIIENSCIITSHISCSIKGIRGLVMSSFMKKSFTKQIAGFLKDWKVYAETGEVSTTKKKEKETSS